MISPEAFQSLSQFTPFPNEPQASYEEYLGDEQAIETPDEGALSSDPMFHHNLAEFVSDAEMGTISSRLNDGITKDINDRKGWVNVLAQGIDYLGIGGHRTRNSQATKNTDIYSSTMLTLGMRVTCKLHSTLFPAGEFVGSTVLGNQDEETTDRSDRIAAFYNYYLRDVLKEYIPDKKQAIFWMVFEGSVFSKVYYDKLKRKPVAPFVRAESVIVNSEATSLEDAERITHEFIISEREYLARVRMKEYKFANLEVAQIYDNPIQQKQDQKLGIQNTEDTNTKIFALHECLVYLDLPGFEHLDEEGEPSGRALPYIVTMDKNSRNIVSIYRNWNENDPEFTTKNYYVQHKYFTGTNIYGYGLFHLLLGYAKGETELQQQLLKAAQLSNAPVLLMAPGMRMEQTQLDIKPGSINQFPSFGADFQNNTKTLGFQPPNMVVLELKKMLTESMSEVTIARQITPENLPSNTTATTMLGVLSTMHVVEDSLVNDLYGSFQKEFQLLYDLFGEWLPEEPYPFLVPGGSHVIMRNDFQPNIAVRPNLDPNVSNQTLQLVINDAIGNLAQQAPDLYNMKEIHTRLLKVMKVSDPDKLFKDEEPPQDPPPLDPITEVKEAMIGNPIKAYKWQDQQAYITIEESTIAQLSQDQMQDQTMPINALNAIVQQRKAFQYVSEMEAQLGYALPEDPSQLHPEQQNQIAMQAAQIILQKKQEEQAANPPPIDPSIVMEHEIEVKEKAAEYKAMADQRQSELQQQKITDEKQIQDLKVQMELARIKSDNERSEREHQYKMMEMEAQQRRYEAEDRIRLIELEVEKMRMNLDSQTKAYDSTLRFEQKAHEEKSHDSLNIQE